jgi:hypothetical protein
MSTKISQLPLATSPVAPDVVLPVVQDGLTKKAAINQLGFLPSGTGATTRTIQNKLRDTASVKDFGAVGDGVVNDTAAINAGFTALNNYQINSLYFPAGTYVVSGALTTITRSGVALTGDGRRQSVISQTANANTLTFSPTAPASATIGDVTIDNIGFDQQGVTSPTSGVMLTLTKVQRGYFNIDIRNAFAGLLIEGCDELFFSDTTISAAYSWSSVAAGSYLVKLAYYFASNKGNSEIFFDGFNIKGTGSYGGPLYLSEGIVIEAADGLFMSNGHVGFSHNVSLYVNAQNNAGAYIQNLEFTQVYFDGNNSGNTGNSLVLIAGSTTPAVDFFKFVGCSFKNYKGNAFNASLTTLNNLQIIGSEFSNCGGYGAILTSQAEFIISGNIFKTLNGNALASSSAIVSLGSSKGVISGNQFLPAQNAHSAAVDIDAASSDIVVGTNTYEGNTADMVVASGAARITFASNRKIGSDPTAVAASTTTIPTGYDVVEITGNTGITSINTPIAMNQVTLVFSGTPTVTDGGNLKLNGNFVATAGSTLSLIGYGGNWSEVARAVV